MKVGILSMHRVINYGSFLQAYALKQLLLQNGADEVSFIDIKPGRELEGFEADTIWAKLRRYADKLLHGKFLTKIHGLIYINRVRNMFDIHIPRLGIGTTDEQYDLAVIGSDEVFNCCQNVTWGYTRQLYGYIPEATRVISYAGSFGHTQYEQLTERKIDKEIGETMKTMAAISVRDENSFDIVKRLTGIDPYIHMDPVLIYGYRNEINQLPLPDEKDYIIVYTYAGRIRNQAEIRAIRDFAQQRGKKILSLYCYYDWCDRSIIPETPFKVLSWFKGADYVITDTFHGTIFSIITHRPFVTLIRPSNKNKICSLLNAFDLSNKGLLNPECLSEVMTSSIDYVAVEAKLDAKRQQTSNYLTSYIL